jgi:HSP20 family protein
VIETAQSILLYADLPGVAPENLRISVEDKVLRLEAEANLDTPDGMKAVYAEFRVPRYVREFTLSNELDAQKIDATLRNGQLTLTIPKAEHAKPRRISVEVR